MSHVFAIVFLSALKVGHFPPRLVSKTWQSELTFNFYYDFVASISEEHVSFVPSYEELARHPSTPGLATFGTLGRRSWLDSRTARNMISLLDVALILRCGSMWETSL